VAVVPLDAELDDEVEAQAPSHINAMQATTLRRQAFMATSRRMVYTKCPDDHRVLA